MFGKKRKQVASMMPLPPKLLAGIVAACAVAALLLLPNQETLLERQLRDEDWPKALESLRGLPAIERVERAEHYDMLEIRLRRLTLAPDDREGFTSALAATIETANGYEFTPGFVDEIEKHAEKSLSAKETYRLLTPHLPQLPRPAQDRLRETLAKRALAEAEPVLALEIFQEYWRWHANEPEVVFHYINLARGAGQPRNALHALDHYEKGLNEPLLKNNRQLAVLKIQLLRENNQPEAAFAEVQKLYAASDPETRQELYALLSETAVQSGNSTALLDELLRRAEASPGDAPRWRELAQLAQAAGRQELAIHALEQVIRAAPQDGTSAFKLAQMYEWTARPSDAFDLYMLAINQGEDAALERLLALNPGLYRDIELAAAVRKTGKRIDLDTHGLNLARLFANLNDFDRARTFYQALLNFRGEDPALLAEYGLLELDLGNLDEALQLYSRAEKADPNNSNLGISIAEAQFRAGAFDTALATYRKLLEAHPSREQLNNYLRLAESMGRIQAAADVLAAYLRDAGDAGKKDYDKLAYFYGILGQRAELEALLETAVRLFPEDEQLRRQLLYAYSDNKEPLKAAAILETFPDLTTNPELAKFHINLLSDAKRYRDVERFVTERLSPTMVEQLNLNQLLASIYYETGNTNAAKELYGRLHRAQPDNLDTAMTYVQFLLDGGERNRAKAVLNALPNQEAPRALKLSAQLHAADREFKEALFFQTKYLATDPPDAGRDWGFLGDLQGERGDRSGAQRSYLRAIAEMLATLSNLPATNANHAPFSAN
jgi:tetratricopeptide (TPR) repeat protein